MKRKLTVVAAATAALVVLAGCSTTATPEEEGGKDITLWLMGGDTPDTLRDYLKTEYAEATCLLYTSPSPRDGLLSRMPSSA